MYRKPKFLEVLHEIREEMSREADFDVDLFAEMVRSGRFSSLSLSKTLYTESTHSVSSKNKSVKAKRKN